MPCSNMLLVAAVGATALLAAAAPKHSFQYKMLNGPPSEFKQMSPPPADASGVYSSHSSGRFNFGKSDTDAPLAWSTNFNVDSVNGFAFAAFVADKGATYALLGPDSKPIDLSKRQSKANAPAGDSPSQVIAGLQWQFPAPTQTGTYRLTVTASSGEALAKARSVRAAKGYRTRSTPKADGYFVIWNDSANLLLAHIAAPTVPVVGHMVGVVAQMVDAKKGNKTIDEHMAAGTTPPPSGDKITAAILDVTFPDGHVETVKMQDDGLHEDGAADDDEYGGLIKTTEAGPYMFKTTFEGTDEQGRTFARVYQQEVPVADDTVAIDLKGHALAYTNAETGRLTIRLPVKTENWASPPTDTIFRPYMEVWAKGANGEETAVAFSTNLARVQTSWGIHFLQVELDLKWAALAQAQSAQQLILKNVMVENMHDLTIISEAQQIPVFHAGADEQFVAAINGTTRTGAEELAEALNRAAKAFDGKVTAVMREGVKPAQYHNNSANLVDGKVVVVHGFCADKNPFEEQASDWTDAVFYSAAREGDGLSNENQDFSDNVLAYIEKQALGTFSLVGQSQGGMVGLHILNYYHTAMDDATTGRKIQSVATPFLGNSALSNFNGIIDVISGDCPGPNSLTRSGAVEWISGITQANVEQTNVYNTEYAPGGLFGGGFCNSFMNLILTGKNDGVAEIVYAMPDAGGNFLGTTVGECHAEGMEWPPSFWSTPRNNEMSDNAAR